MRFLKCLLLCVFIGSYSGSVACSSLTNPEDDFCPLLLESLPKNIRFVIQQTLFDSISSVEGKFQQLETIANLGQEYDKKFYESIKVFVHLAINFDKCCLDMAEVVNYFDLYTITGRLRFKKTYGVSFQDVSKLKNLEVALNSFFTTRIFLNNFTETYCFDLNFEMTNSDSIFQNKWHEHIKCISMHACELSSLPKRVGDWVNLHIVDLSHNQLTSLPASVGDWKAVMIINLSHNLLTSLPESVYHWQSLREIDLRYNQLQVLPDLIGAWQILRKFKVSHNKLTSLPKSMDCWELLTKLDISHNHLTTLPGSVWTSFYLRKLVIDLFAIDFRTSITFWKNPAITIEKPNVLYVFSDGLKNCTNITVVLDEEEWQKPYKLGMLKSQILPLLSLACEYPEIGCFVFRKTASILRDSFVNSSSYQFLADKILSREVVTNKLIIAGLFALHALSLL